MGKKHIIFTFNNQMLSYEIMMKLVIQILILSGLLSQNIYAMPDVSKAFKEVTFITSKEESMTLDEH